MFHYIIYFLGIISIILMIFIFGMWMASSLLTVPDTTNNIFLPGLAAPVTISREPNGVIHITANSDNDLYFAQGVAIAQERFFLI
jgi:penicillin amidase